MFITRETDYAIRIIRALKDSGKISVKQICQIESIPVDFAYKILKKLNKIGLIEVSRGATGGCKLLKNINDIYLIDILKAMNDRIVLNECMEEDAYCVNNPEDNKCKIRGELTRVQYVLENELSRRSLGEVLAARE